MSLRTHLPAGHGADGTGAEGTAPRADIARWRGAVAGLVAAGLALGIAELAAGLLGRAVSPAIVVGGAAIDRTPRPLKEFAIRTFGENDKLVLLAGVFATVALIAAAVGVIAARHRRAGLAGVALLGLVAAGAAATRPAARWYDVLPSLAAAVVGVAALAVLLNAFARAGRAQAARPPGTRLARRPLLLAGVGAAAAAAAGAAGRAVLGARTNVDASRRALDLPRPAVAAPRPPAGAELDVDGISPLYTPPADFYRVDTALSVPRLTTDEWSLRIHGLVDREVELDFAGLLDRRIVEHDITMTCVSNEVGGPLLGSSRWLGVELAPLLREAGIRPGADQLLSRSSDGMTIGTPVSAVMDGRAAMLAIAMNGEPLLPEHGFPVRMVVPGLYGYVSACKWIVDIEVTTFGADKAYWVQRGWVEDAPIRTSSRIDTPRPLSRVKAGTVPVAGLAWAQHRGIEGVQVRVDGGEWQDARLADAVNADMWVQWVWDWDAEPGSHTLQVRAVDATGAEQEQNRRTPFPSGSAGWQSVLVTVE